MIVELYDGKEDNVDTISFDMPVIPKSIMNINEYRDGVLFPFLNENLAEKIKDKDSASIFHTNVYMSKNFTISDYKLPDSMKNILFSNKEIRDYFETTAHCMTRRGIERFYILGRFLIEVVMKMSAKKGISILELGISPMRFAQLIDLIV